MGGFGHGVDLLGHAGEEVEVRFVGLVQVGAADLRKEGVHLGGESVAGGDGGHQVAHGNGVVTGHTFLFEVAAHFCGFGGEGEGIGWAGDANGIHGKDSHGGEADAGMAHVNFKLCAFAGEGKAAVSVIQDDGGGVR